MVKKPKNEFSKSVSRRIDEILRLTTLPLKSFAQMSGISIRSLNAYHQGTVPITLASVLKICTFLSLDLHEFCDFKKKLSLNKQSLAFIEKNRCEIFDSNAENVRRLTQEKYEKDKKDRDKIIHIAQTSDYFERPRTLFQMLVDFSMDYNISVTAERLKTILQRCIAKGFIKKHETPWNYGIGYNLPRRTSIYFKDEELLLKDPKKIFGYKWISDSILI